MTAAAEERPLCALCNQPVIGWGFVTGVGALCHNEIRDCYHRWTVWGQRPDGTMLIGMPTRVGVERGAVG